MAEPAGAPLRAAIFDLFGTLVPEFPVAGFEGMVRRRRAGARRRRGRVHRRLVPDRRGAADGRVPGWDRREHPRDRGGDGRCRAPTEEALERALAPRDGDVPALVRPARRRARDGHRAPRPRHPARARSRCAPPTPRRCGAPPRSPGCSTSRSSARRWGSANPTRRSTGSRSTACGSRPEETLYCGDGSYRRAHRRRSRWGWSPSRSAIPRVVRGEQLRPDGDDWDGAWVGDLRELLDRF